MSPNKDIVEICYVSRIYPRREMRGYGRRISKEDFTGDEPSWQVNYVKLDPAGTFTCGPTAISL